MMTESSNSGEPRIAGAMVEPDGSPDATFSRRWALQASVAAVLSGFLTSARAESAPSSDPDTVRAGGREMSFDEGWLFQLGEIAGAQSPTFDDRSWRLLDLPHDWRIEDLPYASSDDGGATADPSGFAFTNKPFAGGEPPAVIGPFDANADPKLDADLKVPPVGHVIILGGRGQAYTVGNVGWYRKHFTAPFGDPKVQRAELRFDGIYQNADIWLNGIHLGFHPNGYISFAYDLTPHLRSDGENVVAVRVDNRGKTSRWYSGSGIYRHTWLTITGPVRVPLWGVRITTPVVDSRRSIARVSVQVANSGSPTQASVRLTVLNPSGQAMGAQTTPPKALAADATSAFEVEIGIDDAALWTPETPTLYRLRAEVLLGARIADVTETTFGVRSLAFDGSGLRLNGTNVKVRGANIHHDHGPLGSAAIDRAEERTVEILKAAGFNAIRAAHNPPSPHMLATCDRLGMLVYEEFSDMWDMPKMEDDYHRYFAEWWERDLSSMVLRDRNHPSVIIWSIGNEIFEDPNDYGPRLAALVRSLDATRPVSQGGINVSPKGKDPLQYVDVGDFHGAPPPAARAAHPDKAFLQSEDTSPQIYDDWKLAEDNPGYVGTWVWSGWDYLGESGGGATALGRSKGEAFAHAIAGITGKVPYPWFNSFMSDIDLIGQRKPQNYWRAVVNGFSPLEMLVERPTPQGTQQYNLMYAYYDELQSWTWEVPQGQPMTVRVYTSGDSVTLLLNGKPLDTKAVAETDKRVISFSVPYMPGEITAVASLAGHELARKTLTTTGKAAALRLTSDVGSLTTSRGNLAHVLVEVVDDGGRVVPDAVVKVSFVLDGAGELAGVANGNPHNVDSFRRPRRWTWHGQALAILRPGKHPGALSLTATALGLQPARLVLPVAAEKEAPTP
jgi:beta-galactosidase